MNSNTLLEAIVLDIQATKSPSLLAYKVSYMLGKSVEAIGDESWSVANGPIFGRAEIESLLVMGCMEDPNATMANYIYKYTDYIAVLEGSDEWHVFLKGRIIEAEAV